MRLKGFAGALLPVAAVLAAACAPRGVAGPFTVVGVDPTDAVVPVTSTFALTFSDDVDPVKINADTFVLVPSERVNTSFISDMNNPPLSNDRRGYVVSGVLQTNGHEVRFTPDADLPAGADLTLLVSKSVASRAGSPLTDALGKPNGFRLDFTTRDAPPQVVTTSLPTGNPALIPPNLRYFTLTYGSAIQGASESAVRVLGQNGAQDVAVDSVEVLLGGTTLRVRLGDGACSPMCAQTDYRVEVAGSLSGLQGQAAIAFSLEVRTLADADVSPPALVDLPVLQSSENQVKVTLRTREPASGRLRVGSLGGPYDTGFQLFSAGPCSGFQAARECPYTATATGLDLGLSGTGRSYGALLELTDDFGNTAAYGEFTLVTVLLPKIRITEVYNNPPGTSSEEKTQEFVELVNISATTTYDLATMQLAKLDLVTGAVLSKLGMVGLAGTTSLLAPGGYAVVGGTQFDPISVGTDQSATVVVDSNDGRTTLLGGLSSSKTSRKILALFDGDPDSGAPEVTRYRAPEELYAPSSTFPEGTTAERLSLTEADDVVAWCISPNGPTPGRVNTVDGLAACP